MYKIIFIAFIILSQNLSAAVISNAGNKDNIYLEGIGLELSKKYILTTNMIFDEDLPDLDKDNVFITHNIFFDYFPASNAEIDYQYGLGFDFGYGYKKWDFYTGLGFIRASFEYDDSTQVQDYARNSVYYGVGASYNLTKRFAIKVNAKTYEIDFRDSDGDKINFRNNSVNLVLGVNF